MDWQLMNLFCGAPARGWWRIGAAFRRGTLSAIPRVYQQKGDPVVTPGRPNPTHHETRAARSTCCRPTTQMQAKSLQLV